MAPDPSIQQLAINTIRTLAMDAVQTANSGHPVCPRPPAVATYSTSSGTALPAAARHPLLPAGTCRLRPEFAALAQAGHPVIRLHLQDKYDLGGQFFLWEMATAVASNIPQTVLMRGLGVLFALVAGLTLAEVLL